MILISSGVFEQKFSEIIDKTRLSRLDRLDLKKLKHLQNVLRKGSSEEKDRALLKIGSLYKKVDSYNLIPQKEEVVRPDYHINSKVWKEAVKLRISEKLISLAKNINCQVIATHGDYDSHPATGVEKPLKKAVKNFKFILLKNCGHYPWYEKEAKDRFFKTLNSELP